MSGEATWSKKKKDFLGGLSHHTQLTRTCDHLQLSHISLYKLKLKTSS